MSKNKMNKALAANRVVALFSHKDKNGTPRYDIYKMKQESNPPTTTPQCTHLSMYFEGVQKQSSEPATKQMMRENQRRMLGGYGEYSTLVPIRNRPEYGYKRFAQLIIIQNLVLNIV